MLLMQDLQLSAGLHLPHVLVHVTVPCVESMAYLTRLHHHAHME